MKKILSCFFAFLIFLCISASARETDNITRIEFIAYLMSSIGEINSEKDPGFSDLNSDSRYYNYAAAAKEYGIAGGYEDNTLRPYADITRQDAVVMLCRAYKMPSASGVYISSYADFSEISNYAAGYVSAAARNGIIKYEPGKNFEPKAKITPDEMTELCNKFKEYADSVLNFSFGYPKKAKSQEYKAITVSLKTTRACTVFYKLSPVSSYLGGFKPKPEEIDKFLTSISITGNALDINIYPPDSGVYNLYIVARGDDGKYSDVECIKNVTAHRFAQGSGTEKDPYMIYDAEQLAGIKYYPAAHYSLQSDIVLTQNWKPIETDDGHPGFAGVLEGNHHRITGMKIMKYTKNTGFFAVVYGGKIKNLYIDAEVKGQDNVGIIAGTLEGGSITGCFVTGRVKANGNNGGGIVGANNGEIKDSVSAAYMVEASAYAGGIAGSNRVDIINCLSAVYTVSADMYASGIAGANLGGRINFNVAANLYADDIITTKSGRITTNKQYGRTSGNYCYDKMMSDSTVDFDYESHDGLEASWAELTSPQFYSETMGWDTKKVWNDSVSEDFRLLLPRGFTDIDMIKGITMYAPVKLYTAQELMKVHENPNYHYILMNDISLEENSVWNMIGDDKSDETGFNGTFDGNGHTISGLHIDSVESKIYGMFGVISAGTVRNLNLKNLSIEGHSLAGGIAGINYGYIENCSVSGKIYLLRKNTLLSVGGICADNYGFIEDTVSNVTVRADGQVLTAGGIAANNEGFINRCVYTGNIRAEQKSANSNAVAGGICGINTSGMIFSCSSNPEITSKASVSYIGGIAGIMNGGKISEDSASVKMYIKPDPANDSAVYAGGIAGLTPEGVLTNSTSQGDIFAESNKLYLGGITGYNQNTALQNTYTLVRIDAKSGIFDLAQGYVGGICGYSEGGVISENIAANRAIITNAVTDKVANIDGEAVFCANNYYCAGTAFDAEENEHDSGAAKADMTQELFFLPIAQGGRLGWSEEIWGWDSSRACPYLKYVKTNK